MDPPDHGHGQDDDDQVGGHVATAERDEIRKGLFAHPRLARVPHFGQRAAGEDVAEDQREAKGGHEGDDCVGGSEERLVGAEDCDEEMDDGDLDRCCGGGPEGVRGHPCLWVRKRKERVSVGASKM